MKGLWLAGSMLAVVGACGGAAEPEGGAEEPAGATAAPAANGAGSGPSGAVANQQPPGQGYASVDGQEFTLDMPGGLACEVGAEEFAFSFIIGDNEVALGGGASISGGQWFGSLTLQIFEDNDVTQYVAKLVDNPSGVAVDGNSVSYAGPMEKLEPAPPGELPQPIDVGDGVFSATCA